MTPVLLDPGESVTVTAAAAAPPPPPPPVLALPPHGPGIRAQSKGNVESNSQKRQAIIFRAAKTGLIDTVQVSLRGGPTGYSGGNGGIHRFAFEEYASGIPVGASGSITPGNPGVWTTYPRISVGVPVVAGTLYRCWVDNIDSSPGQNFVSLNHLYNWDGAPPNGRNQPRFPSGEWALEVTNPSTGAHITNDERNHTPVAAFRYTDGTWQGNGYVGMIGGIPTLPGKDVSYGIIGGTKKVRSTWQVSSADTIRSLYVGGIRCQTPGPLYVALWGPAGVLDEIVCPPIPTSSPGGDMGGTSFVGGLLPNGSLNLSAGSYQVRLSSSGVWSAAPIREGTEYGFDPTVCWANGKFQVSSDGTTFTDPYAGLDLQWFGER